MPKFCSDFIHIAQKPVFVFLIKGLFFYDTDSRKAFGELSKPRILAQKNRTFVCRDKSPLFLNFKIRRKL